MWKFYDNDDTNDRQLQRTNFDKKSLLEHSAQVSILRKEKTHNFRTLDCTTFSGWENDESHIATPGTLFYQISLFWGHITTVFHSLFKFKNIYKMHFCWKTSTLLNIHVYCNIELKKHFFIITYVIYIFVNYIITFQLRRNTKWFFFYIQWKSEGLIMTCYHTCSKIFTCTCTCTSSAVKMKLSIKT